jgi:predicted component of type VI protein secretion system
MQIGRTRTSQLHVKGDPAVSQKHAVITWAYDRWWIQDVGSSNGTAINGEELEPDDSPTGLRDGDVLTIGTDTTAKVTIVKAAAAAEGPRNGGGAAKKRKPAAKKASVKEKEDAAAAAEEAPKKAPAKRRGRPPKKKPEPEPEPEVEPEESAAAAAEPEPEKPRTTKARAKPAATKPAAPEPEIVATTVAAAAAEEEEEEEDEDDEDNKENAPAAPPLETVEEYVRATCDALVDDVKREIFAVVKRLKDDAEGIKSELRGLVDDPEGLARVAAEAPPAVEATA